jgi:hypothetical protein
MQILPLSHAPYKKLPGGRRSFLRGWCSRAGYDFDLFGCDPDEVPAPPDEAMTRRGDLWLLGEHRLVRQCRTGTATRPKPLPLGWLCELRELSAVPQAA